MSFGINGPDPIPLIKTTQFSSDGSGGNTGYFQQQKKNKDEKKEESDILELSTKKDDEKKEEKSDERRPDSIGTKIKTFWFSIHGIFNEVIDENSK